MKKKICLVFCRKDSKRLKIKFSFILGKPLLYYTYKNIKIKLLRIILSTDVKK